MKAIKAKSSKKDPFDSHKRTKESNLPFVKASRTLYMNKNAYAVLGTEGFKYNGENQLDRESEVKDGEGYLDVETVINVLIHELMVTKSDLLKLKKVVEKSEVV